MMAGGRRFDDGLAARPKVASPAPVLKEIYLSDLKRQRIRKKLEKEARVTAPAVATGTTI